MRKHAIRVLVLLLVLGFAGSSLQAGPSRNSMSAGRDGERLTENHQAQRLTGFGGLLESRLEALLRWVRRTFGDESDDGRIGTNGLTDDPDPTSDEFDPEGPVEDGAEPLPDHQSGDEELEEDEPFIPAAREN